MDNFYNGSISKSQKGLEISVISVVDVSAHQGYTLSVKQTAKTDRQRIDAELRYCYTGEQKPKGAPRKYDGKVDLSDLSRLEFGGELVNGTKLYSQVVWHVSLKRKIRIVCLGLLHGRETRPQRLRYLLDQRNPSKQRVALLFSTDISKVVKIYAITMFVASNRLVGEACP